MSLKREDVLAYVNRDWAGARRHKDASMGRWVEVNGTEAAFRLSDMLLAQVWERARVEKARQGYADLREMRRKLDRAQANRR
jgi:hypothetical protein